MKEPKFQIGDRVRYVCENTTPDVEYSGAVRKIEMSWEGDSSYPNIYYDILTRLPYPIPGLCELKTFRVAEAHILGIKPERKEDFLLQNFGDRVFELVMAFEQLREFTKERVTGIVLELAELTDIVKQIED